MEKNTYIPGVCNIGEEEIKKRKRAGWIGLVVMAALLAYLQHDEVSEIWNIALFFPAMMSATGFLQARSRFCVYFGLTHLFNFGDVGKTDSVSQAEFRAKDRKKAWKIILHAAAIGVVAVIFGYIL